MEGFSIVVLLEALLEISGHSHIALAMFGKTFNKIDIMHKPILRSATARSRKLACV
jgi:hypothetical protein